jgi:hypothetical protein
VIQGASAEGSVYGLASGSRWIAGSAHRAYLTTVMLARSIVVIRMNAPSGAQSNGGRRDEQSGGHPRRRPVAPIAYSEEACPAPCRSHSRHCYRRTAHPPPVRPRAPRRRLSQRGPLSLINDEVSRGPLLAPEYLALQHPVSIPQRADASVGLRDGAPVDGICRYADHRATIWHMLSSGAYYQDPGRDY